MSKYSSGDPASWSVSVDDTHELRERVSIVRQRARDAQNRLEAARKHHATDEKAYNVACADAALNGERQPAKPAHLKESAKEFETAEQQAAPILERAREIETHATHHLQRAVASELLELRKAQVEAARAAYTKFETAARDLAAVYSVDEAKALLSPMGLDRVSFAGLSDDTGITPKIAQLDYMSRSPSEGSDKFEHYARAAEYAAGVKARPATATEEAPAITGATKE